MASQYISQSQVVGLTTGMDDLQLKIDEVNIQIAEMKKQRFWTLWWTNAYAWLPTFFLLILLHMTHHL